MGILPRFFLFHPGVWGSRSPASTCYLQDWETFQHPASKVCSVHCRQPISDQWCIFPSLLFHCHQQDWGCPRNDKGQHFYWVSIWLTHILSALPDLNLITLWGRYYYYVIQYKIIVLQGRKLIFTKFNNLPKVIQGFKFRLSDSMAFTFPDTVLWSRWLQWWLDQSLLWVRIDLSTWGDMGDVMSWGLLHIYRKMVTDAFVNGKY